ncbi:MAG: oligosaccharide flippase family protein [Hyphomicrobiaceae bacterium]
MPASALPAAELKKPGGRLAGFKIPPVVLYVLSVAFDKGFALLTIPLAAAYLAPAEFGRLDVAVSLVEVAGLVLALAHGESLLRFASTALDEPARRRVSAEFLGSGLLLAGVLGAGLQFAAGPLVSALSIGIDMTAMRWALGGATVMSLIDMPLMWWRLHQRAKALFAFSLLRSLVQVAAMWIVFAMGYGAEGVLMSNALIAISIAAVLTVLQFRSHGVALSAGGLQRAAFYGLPLVVSGLATFAVGNLSRWFLSGRVSDVDIAYLALATKLGLATSLALQPFSLWWIAQRMRVFNEPDGARRSALHWGQGVIILLAGAYGVCLAGPVFIHLVLPASYQAAALLLPAAVLVCVLNELSTLTNVGSHLRTTGLAVMTINIAGAIAAVIGYGLLIPRFGALGALFAMMLGHATRLVLFAADGHIVAPIPYPAMRAGAVAVGVALLVWAAPSADAVWLRMGWAVLGGLALIALALALRLIEIPAAFLPSGIMRLQNAGSR